MPPYAALIASAFDWGLGAARRLLLSCWGEYPIKRQDSKEFRFGCLAVPSAIGIRAGKLLVSKDFHRFSFRERHITAFLL